MHDKSSNVEADFLRRTDQTSILEQETPRCSAIFGVVVVMQLKFALGLIFGNTKNKRLQPLSQLKPLGMYARQ